MKLNILIGGKAGQGPNIITHMLAEALVKQGYYVFYARDYESLIRGGHNFNTLTFSDSPIQSNESKIDILVALDDKTEVRHKKDLKSDVLILKGHTENMFYLGALFKILGLEFSILENELKRLKNFEENMKDAKQGFGTEMHKCKVEKVVRKLSLVNGSQGIAEGAIKSGLDIYFAYPMTPATPLLFELSPLQQEKNFLALELENEISVINTALGASITGAKAMVGTSGGGFDLMTEALSMAGQAEIPIVVYLASRPGPSTGLATHTSQGDLKLALNCGHGEFFRLVLAPGDTVECKELTSQAFYFSQKYKIPAIILSDKHLAESFYSTSEIAKIQQSKKATELIRYNSYEHIKTGEATEDAEAVKKNFDRRMKNYKEIAKEAEKFQGYKIYRNKKSKNLIIGWGSTKGAILDAMPQDSCFLQVLYMNPFPDISKELKKAGKIVIIENNATGQLADLIREKTGVEIKEKILRYDGRPFLQDELKKEIARRLGR